MQQINSAMSWILLLASALIGLSLLLGCGSFAFYEETKVAVSIKVDPKAPDPVELAGAFKESVLALVPVGRSDGASPTLTLGPILSDFDVRYGVNAGAAKNRADDFLYASVTHGIATGTAATTLAWRTISADQARRLVMINFLRQLSDSQIRTASDGLKVSGLGTPDVATLRSRSIELVNSSSPSDLGTIEQEIKKVLPAFNPWKP